MNSGLSGLGRPFEWASKFFLSPGVAVEDVQPRSAMAGMG